MHTETAVSPNDLLGILERNLRQALLYVMHPQQDFSTESLKRSLANIYGRAEELEALIAKMNEKPNGQAEAN
jgi:hypothetical protein